VKTLKLSTFGTLLGGAALLVLLFTPGTALAHERRTVANGKYDVAVGWDVEPAYVGMKNAASIRIMDAGTPNPVSGAEKGLKLAIRQGASTQSFPVRAVFGQNGYYVADIVPTRVGDYQWMFTGDINGASVNETFDTADGKFNAVEPANTLQFPVQLGDPAQNAAAVTAAQSDAQSARTLAYIGIAVGVLGLLAGVGAWVLRARPAAVPMPSAGAGRPASERV
jgi:hypothetical protein